MNAEKYATYKCGVSANYQPYWVLWCVQNNYLYNVDLVSVHEFIIWIGEKHREFNPDREARKATDYQGRFLAWLEKQVLT